MRLANAVSMLVGWSPAIQRRPSEPGVDLGCELSKRVEVEAAGELIAIPFKQAAGDLAEDHAVVEAGGKGGTLKQGRDSTSFKAVGALDDGQAGAGGFGDTAWRDVAGADCAGVLVEASDDETAVWREVEVGGDVGEDRSEVGAGAGDLGELGLVQAGALTHFRPPFELVDVDEAGKAHGAAFGDVLAGEPERQVVADKAETARALPDVRLMVLDPEEFGAGGAR